MVLKQWRDTQAECSQSDLEMAAALKAKVSKKIVLMEGFAKFKSHEVHLFLEGDFFVSFSMSLIQELFESCLISVSLHEDKVWLIIWKAITIKSTSVYRMRYVQLEKILLND